MMVLHLKKLGHSILLSIATLGLIITWAHSQNDIPVSLIPDVETSVDRNQMFIGDVFHLTITLTFEPSVEIENPSASIDLGQFEILDINTGVTQDLTGTDKKLRKLEFTLSTYFTGEFEIPAFDIRYFTEAGQIGIVQTAPIKINVIPLTPEESENLEIKGLKEQSEVEGKSYLNLLLLLLFLFILLLAIAYWLWKKYTKQSEPEAFIQRQTPQEEALQALAKLRENTDLIEQKQYKEFSIEVSSIMRRYIESRWGIPALDETSYEILRDLHHNNIDQDIIQQFNQFFDNCDLMKFAKHEPQPNEMTELIDLAEDIVHATPLPSIEPEATTQTISVDSEANA